MATQELTKARKGKQDEFYTQYNVIQKEINAYLDYDPDVFKDKTILLPCDDPEWSNFTKFFITNFKTFGIKKLISTSYAKDSKLKLYGQLDLFEDADFIKNSEKYNPNCNASKGKIFTLTKGEEPVDIENLKWEYLECDGDFRSDEVKKIRDEADIIITNPPFSLFREFLAWLRESNKKFLIIGNVNAITYKEVFPLIQSNQLWLGPSIHSGDREFGVPKSYPLEAAGFRVDERGNKYIRVKGVRWFTNMEHGRRHSPLQLMSKADNIKFNKKLKEPKYPTYVNYPAIEVSSVDAIPNDYKGEMGVPITFLDKYCPEQFEILGYSLELAKRMDSIEGVTEGSYSKGGNALYIKEKNGNFEYRRLYGRILIKHKA